MKEMPYRLMGGSEFRAANPGAPGSILELAVMSGTMLL
jgi:hypothetical protein